MEDLEREYGSEITGEVEREARRLLREIPPTVRWPTRR